MPDVRPITDDDREKLSKSPDAPHIASASMVVTRDKILMAAGGIDPPGALPHPEKPRLWIVPVAREFDPALDLPPLVATLQEAASERGLKNLLLGWDPMDAIGLKILETCGFRPVGQMPYFPLPGGQIQYVSGYQDASGSILDLSFRP